MFQTNLYIKSANEQLLDIGDTTVSFQLPAALPSGQYLARVEHIALHSASTSGGAQFYISCAQISVTGGGNGTPGPLVAFPGAYKATDPGLLIDIYYPVVCPLPFLVWFWIDRLA